MLLPPVCPLCGAIGDAPCVACRRRLRPVGPVTPPPGVERCRAVFRYEGAGRALVTGLKYRNRRSAAPWVAGEMAGLVKHLPDVVTWVPSRPASRARRGFDQGEVLARRVARRLRVPARRLLRRRGSRAQTGRSSVERRQGPDLVARPQQWHRVLVVDDVMTTGASLRQAAAALRAAGAAEVDAVVAAWTPRATSRSMSPSSLKVGPRRADA